MPDRNITFHHGRDPNNPTKPRLLMTSLHVSALPPPDEEVDYLSAVQEWPMYGNDYYGTCTVAGEGHILQAVSEYGSPEVPQVVLPEKAVVDRYWQLTGGRDTGLVMQDVLNDWRKNGVEDANGEVHKILAFAEVDTRDEQVLIAALQHFGHLYVGINFPRSAMDQFNQHRPWDYVAGSRLEGGHAIHVGAANRFNDWECVTWAAVQQMTQTFWDQYVEEAWVVITPEWLDAVGHSPEGLDLYALGEDFAALTGESNPFPPPEPPVDPNVVDDDLAAAIRQHLARNPRYYQSFAEQCRTWMSAKGYSLDI